jgi:hypothetical protein
MSSFKRGLVVVTRYIRNLRGGSQPILAEASDGLLYVVKFINNLQGANLSFNESAGSELYSAFGLAGPAWKPLLVTNSFVEQNPPCWMRTSAGPLRPASGLCFGSRFLGENGTRLLEILPESSYKRISNHKSFWAAWMIDICASHVENRKAIFREDAKGRWRAFFVDNGHLFGGPTGGQQQRFLALRYLDARIYRGVALQYLLNLQRAPERLDADQLWKRVRALPDDWKTASAVDGFAQCLERLSTPKLLQNVVDTMFEAFQRSDEFERSGFQCGRGASHLFLHTGIQAEGLGCSPVASRTDDPPRA